MVHQVRLNTDVVVHCMASLVAIITPLNHTRITYTSIRLYLLDNNFSQY